MKNLFVAVVLLFYFTQNTHVFAFLVHYDAYIVNSLPSNNPKLTIHIFSGDDDLGFHDLLVNQQFHWDFTSAAFDRTKFYGSFQWGQKNRGFAVYDWKLANDHCGFQAQNNVCWWVVKEDGFYLANKTNPSPKELVYMNWWLPHDT
ncbi:hypothetical protein M9H77_34355 [Catharanthus roseus]|uniref:Uncharacterized protein n=1 Tax=Catharanthus roseus TaxID=4058 RepID=A0ACB9ZL74_CATRO|nr:hypothetical protein M9H77_34355 [Catharanthus roseus]